MSRETWKKEFMPIPADQVKKEDMLAWCLKKFEGFLPENLEKHGITKEDYGSCYVFKENGEYLDATGSGNCPICHLHTMNEDQSILDCDKCVFVKMNHHYCAKDGQPYDVFIRTGQPYDLIDFFKKAIEKGLEP